VAQPRAGPQGPQGVQGAVGAVYKARRVSSQGGLVRRATKVSKVRRASRRCFDCSWAAGRKACRVLMAMGFQGPTANPALLAKLDHGPAGNPGAQGVAGSQGPQVQRSRDSGSAG
jgi:hypothetical protein